MGPGLGGMGGFPESGTLSLVGEGHLEGICASGKCVNSILLPQG